MFERTTLKRSGRESSIPARLEEVEPGPVLAALLSTVDAESLRGHEAVVVLRAAQKMASHYAAQMYRSMGAITSSMVDPTDEPGEAEEFAHRGAAMEIRAALRLTRRTAENEPDMATSLVRGLPSVLSSLDSGAIDVRKARTIAHGVSHLDPDAARAVADLVIEDAPRLTTGQLAAKVRSLCIEVNPEDAKSRFNETLDSRRVISEQTPDGTANLLILDGSPDRVAEARHNINHIALTLRTRGEARTMDQLRCDVALDLLTGRGDYKSTGRGTVALQVDMETLMCLADSPGDLAGYGPVVADVARQVTAQQQQAEWRFTVIDPDTKLPLHRGTTRRRPTTDQSREVQGLHRTCVFPGCRMPARECDLDHTKPWVTTGHTIVGELAPGCRYDHVGRHRFRWEYQALPGGTGCGPARWATPTQPVDGLHPDNSEDGTLTGRCRP